MRTIELFAGTGSFSQVMRDNDHSIFQVEKFPHRNNLVDLAVDVRQLKGEDFPPDCDMLWASPPYETCFLVNVYIPTLAPKDVDFTRNLFCF